VKKFKGLILLALFIISIISFTGCADKQIILVPQTEYYPTFDTSEFNVSEPYVLDMWVNVEDTNGTDGTKEVSLCSDKQEMLGLIRDTKELRAKYNVLLKELNKFNKVIVEMNEKQNAKQPKEVDTIDNKWFK
jgi:hypothetical protein